MSSSAISCSSPESFFECGHLNNKVNYFPYGSLLVSYSIHPSMPPLPASMNIESFKLACLEAIGAH